MKQTERILEAMRANPDGVCSTMMVNEYIMRPAARIGELKAQGHNIVTVECPYFHHGHPTNVATYKLMPRNAVPVEPPNETNLLGDEGHYVGDKPITWVHSDIA